MQFVLKNFAGGLVQSSSLSIYFTRCKLLSSFVNLLPFNLKLEIRNSKLFPIAVTFCNPL